MLLLRNVYNVKSTQEPITWVKFRWRVRKYWILVEQNVLVENSENGEEEVRFAIQSGEDPQKIVDFIRSMIPNVEIELVLENIPNPVLSKFKVNDESRYDI